MAARASRAKTDDLEGDQGGRKQTLLEGARAGEPLEEFAPAEQL
jgi:hypothetical protein